MQKVGRQVRFVPQILYCFVNDTAKCDVNQKTVLLFMGCKSADFEG